MAQPALGPQLSDITRRFHAASHRLDTLVGAITDDVWAARPDETSWSPAECVAHLNLTGEAYVPRIEEAIERARALDVATSRRYRTDLFGGLLSTMVGPLPRIAGRRRGRVKTPPAFVPGGEQPRDEILATFRRLQERQIALVAEADGLPIDRVKVRSAFVERMSFNLYSTFRILPRHQHRHLQQAEEAAGRA